MSDYTPKHADDAAEVAVAPENTKTPLLTSSMYDKVKWLATIFFPAIGSLYFALAGLWHLPAAEEVVGTIVVVDTFLGALLVTSTRSYNQSEAAYDGTIEVSTQPDETELFQLALNEGPEALKGKDQVVFKITSV